MFRLAAISLLALLICFFLPWWHNNEGASFYGFNNPEGYFIIGMSLIAAVVLVYDKRQKSFRFSGVFFPMGLAGVSIVYLFYFFLKESGKPFSSVGPGIFILLIASLLLLIAGGMIYLKHPKEIFSGIIFFLLLSGAAYAYKFVLTDRFADAKKAKADHTDNAIGFIRSFETNSAEANKKYREKIITISGRISEIESVDSSVNVKFIDPNSGSYIIFAFQQDLIYETKKLSQGDSVAIKGSCSGGEYSDILSTTFITFKRSVLEQKY